MGNMVQSLAENMWLNMIELYFSKLKRTHRSVEVQSSSCHTLTLTAQTCQRWILGSPGMPQKFRWGKSWPDQLQLIFGVSSTSLKNTVTVAAERHWGPREGTQCPTCQRVPVRIWGCAMDPRMDGWILKRGTSRNHVGLKLRQPRLIRLSIYRCWMAVFLLPVIDLVNKKWEYNQDNWPCNQQSLDCVLKNRGGQQQQSVKLPGKRVCTIPSL